MSTPEKTWDVADPDKRLVVDLEMRTYRKRKVIAALDTEAVVCSMCTGATRGTAISIRRQDKANYFSFCAPCVRLMAATLEES